MCRKSFSLFKILIATFTPVSTFLANFTLAKFPSPSVLPSSYLPTFTLPLELILLPNPSNPKKTLQTPTPLLPNPTPQDLFFLHGCHIRDFSTFIFTSKAQIPNPKPKPKKTTTNPRSSDSSPISQEKTSNKSKNASSLRLRNSQLLSEMKIKGNRTKTLQKDDNFELPSLKSKSMSFYRKLSTVLVSCL